MTIPELSEENEAHKLLSRVKRSRVLSAYFSLKDKNVPAYVDSDDAVLYLIPIEYYESYLSLSVPYDPLMKRILDLSI